MVARIGVLLVEALAARLGWMDGWLAVLTCKLVVVVWQARINIGESAFRLSPCRPTDPRNK